MFVHGAPKPVANVASAEHQPSFDKLTATS
jgi:hypothetical protein